MSRKQFRKLAEIISLAHPYTDGCDQAQKIVRDIAGSLAQLCADENPRFDKVKFFTACGYPRN